MKKNNLQIVKEENKIVIKKPIGIFVWAIYGIVFIIGIVLPFVWDEWSATMLLADALTICSIIWLFSFFKTSFERIVVDISKKEITVTNFRKHTYHFDDVTCIETSFEEGKQDGERDSHIIVFLSASGRESKFHMSSQKQAGELVELLSSIIFAEKSLG